MDTVALGGNGAGGRQCSGVERVHDQRLVGRRQLAGAQQQIQAAHQRGGVSRQGQLVGVGGLDVAGIQTIGDQRHHVIQVATNRTLADTLKFRRHHTGAQGRGRRHVAGSKKIEHRGRAQRALPELRCCVAQVADLPVTTGRSDAKAARPLHQAQHRFAQLAVLQLRQAGR